MRSVKFWNSTARLCTQSKSLTSILPTTILLWSTHLHCPCSKMGIYEGLSNTWSHAKIANSPWWCPKLSMPSCSPRHSYKSHKQAICNSRPFANIYKLVLKFSYPGTKTFSDRFFSLSNRIFLSLISSVIMRKVRRIVKVWFGACLSCMQTAEIQTRHSSYSQLLLHPNAHNRIIRCAGWCNSSSREASLSSNYTKIR